MTKSEKKPGGLNLKMTLVSIAGIILGVGIYFLILAIGKAYIENEYMSPEAVSARKAQIHHEFANFVSAGNINGNNSAAVAGWTAEHEHVTIYLFETGLARHSYSQGKSDSSQLPKNYNSEVYGRLYPVRFADGIYHIAITESSQHHQTMLVKIGALSAACLAFLLLHLLYTRRLTKRIIELSKEAGLVSSGDLWRSIGAQGSDELSHLARSMDEMRLSVIQRMGKETQAWQANSELITAISHDIRTPMTSLIGYLALLNDGAFEDEERAKQFAASAYGKAMELKDLTDQLFRYFLLYGKAELELDMESFDASMLLGQMAAEAAFDLSDAGFRLEYIESEGDAIVQADPIYLKRVFDNIVSNIKKYADPAMPVVIMWELGEREISLCVSNTVARSMDRVESTKIGLRSCEKIMQAMGGSFSVSRDADHFAAEIRLPAQKNPGT